MQIWKFPLVLASEQTITMPQGAEILTLQMQYEKPNIWARCSEMAEKESVRICMYGTGNTVPDDPGKYLGTIQWNNGTLILHVYEASRG